jgi:iron(III) transport system permease protein
MGRLAVSLALLALAVLVLAPVGTLVFESLRVDVVETRGGERLKGHVKDRDERGVTIRVHGTTVSRFVERADVVSEGRAFSLLNYADVLSGTGERNMLLATLALAGAATLLALVVGLPLGILLGATDLPGRRFLEILTVLPLVLPPILLAIATYHDLIKVEPSFLRAVLVFGLSLFPLVSLFTARAVRATGAQAVEAALLQAPARVAAFKVLLPPALPGALSGALLVFVFVVSDFAVPDFLGVTTAKNTITVYANAVFRYWSADGNVGKATAAGMPPTLLALAAFGLLLRVERRRAAATVGAAYREPDPLPLGPARWPLLVAVLALLALTLVWPSVRHLETAGGKHFGDPVALRGVGGQPIADDPRAKPRSTLDGLRRGVRHERVGVNAVNSLTLAGGAALLATLLALALAEAGRGRPRLDRFLLVASFLPVAVPPMALSVGWVTFFGPKFVAQSWAATLLLGARLLPFATFAVRAARDRVQPELLDAAAVAGLSPLQRTLKVTLPLVAHGAALGFLLAFLFGLREVDAIVFTRSGAETIPVQLYNMIHYGFDVQVAGLSFLWTVGLALLLVVVGLTTGRRFRILP